jgi:hypothetical protein
MNVLLSSTAAQWLFDLLFDIRADQRTLRFPRLVQNLNPSDRQRMKDHYAVLGLEADASLAEVKSAYRKNASKFHPDKNSAPDAPTRFREIQEAYELLSDATKRQAYDENRRRSLLENPLESALGIWKNYINKVLQ